MLITLPVTETRALFYMQHRCDAALTNDGIALFSTSSDICHMRENKTKCILCTFFCYKLYSNKCVYILG